MLTGYCSPAARDNRPVLQVHGAARRAGVQGSVHATGQPRDEQAVKLASLAERELADLIAVHADRRYLLKGQLAAVEDEQQLVALGRVGCPVHGEQCADRKSGAQFLGDLTAQRGPRALTRLDVPASYVPIGKEAYGGGGR